MKRTLSLALSVVVTSILPLSVWAQPAGSLSGPGHMWQGGWHGWYAGPLMMLFFFAIVVAVVVLIVKGFGGSRTGGPAMGRQTAEHGALEILKERFARGEIDKAEYEERKRVLEQ